MAVYDNSGSLSKNAKKEKPNHPDYQGSATIGGVEFWLSAWIKDGTKGKWMSLAFKPKDEKPESKAAAKKRIEDLDELAVEDDIPF